ncbi:energy transducer TonB [Pedobacter psychrodurus]|uniref:Energy transducer TonB n=1 Tax=Pedobacter psychrodurus TaxID=2530456 RepID=A0A4R0PJ10_9SPHI|nr:energy transducer TonB [Pedobacter psychrodurus]TCD17500.1 energy transducer TonB [Pedobacter psychrodurus]
MRKLIFLALMGIAMYYNSAKAQNNPDKVYDFVSVEKQPGFPGGISNFYKYLSHEIKYPEAAKKNKTQGKVFASFVVEKNGALTDLQVIRSLSTETDKEALRVLNKSPRWNPGLIDGKPVRVKYNIAINFAMK